MFAKLALPLALIVPVMFVPVPVTINMFALPAELMLTLPLALGMLILLVPLATPAVFNPVNWLPLPIKKLAVMLPVALNVLADITLAPVMLPPEPPVVKLPIVALPDTDSVVNVPTAVICVWLALALIVVPTMLIPVPASYTWLVLNVANVILLVPNVIVPAGALRMNAVPSLTVPPSVKK